MTTEVVGALAFLWWFVGIICFLHAHNFRISTINAIQLICYLALAVKGPFVLIDIRSTKAHKEHMDNLSNEIEKTSSNQTYVDNVKKIRKQNVR